MDRHANVHGKPPEGGILPDPVDDERQPAAGARLLLDHPLTEVVDDETVTVFHPQAQQIHGAEQIHVEVTLELEGVADLERLRLVEIQCTHLILRGKDVFEPKILYHFGCFVNEIVLKLAR